MCGDAYNGSVIKISMQISMTANAFRCLHIAANALTRRADFMRGISPPERTRPARRSTWLSISLRTTAVDSYSKCVGGIASTKRVSSLPARNHPILTRLCAHSCGRRDRGLFRAAASGKWPQVLRTRPKCTARAQGDSSAAPASANLSQVCAALALEVR